MTKELLRIKLDDTKLKDIIVDSEQATLVFEHDQVILRDFHDQDCCESVYADWSTFKLYKEQLTNSYNELVIKGVDGEGLLVCFVHGDYTPLEKVFVPCYDQQNGYYSSDLKLQVEHAGTTTEISITDYEETVEE